MPDVRQTILETLSQKGPLGIEEIAHATHLSKMAARYHLNLLRRDGLVFACGVESGRSVGRPATRYALSEKAHDLLPKQYGAFATMLMDEIVRTLGSRQARELLRKAGRRVATAAPPLDRDAGRALHLKRVVSFLSSRGYCANWGRTGDRYELVVHDCPYREVASAHPLACEFDRALIGSLLGAHFAMTDCIATDDAECHFVIGN